MTGPKIPAHHADEIPTVVRIVCGPREHTTRYSVSPAVAVLPGQPVRLDLTALAGPATFLESAHLLALVVETVAPAAAVSVMGKRNVVGGVVRLLRAVLSVPVEVHHGSRRNRG